MFALSKFLKHQHIDNNDPTVDHLSNFIFTSSMQSQVTNSHSFSTFVLQSWHGHSGKRTFQ